MNETRMHCVCDRGQNPQTPPQTGGRPLPAVCRIPVITFACFQKKSCYPNPTPPKVEMRRRSRRPVVPADKSFAVVTEYAPRFAGRGQRLCRRGSLHSHWREQAPARLHVVHRHLAVLLAVPLVSSSPMPFTIFAIQLWCDACPARRRLKSQSFRVEFHLCDGEVLRQQVGRVELAVHLVNSQVLSAYLFLHPQVLHSEMPYLA